MDTEGKNRTGKKKKTLSLPVWICDLLDAEGEMLGGHPGLATAAAALMFAEAPPAVKAEYLRRIHEREVADAYDLSGQRDVKVPSAPPGDRRKITAKRPLAKDMAR